MCNETNKIVALLNDFDNKIDIERTELLQNFKEKNNQLLPFFEKVGNILIKYYKRNFDIYFNLTNYIQLNIESNSYKISSLNLYYNDDNIIYILTKEYNENDNKRFYHNDFMLLTNDYMKLSNNDIFDKILNDLKTLLSLK